MKAQIRMMLTILLAANLAVPVPSSAQRLGHGGGGTRNRPSTGRAPAGNRGAINGGATRSPDRPATQPSGGRNGQRDGSNQNLSGATDKRGDIGSKNTRNNVNVDKSHGDVNINIDNSKHVNVSGNTVVRRNTAVYARPPYVYGGHRYYCYHPYYYHPYHAFYWGPVWHPWGFFVATMAATAIIVTVANQQYHYDQGVYYQQSGSGYTVVQAPVGATVTTLPQGTQTVVINETTNNYYYGGTYYEKSANGYTVVPPTAGTVVENLPDGGEEVKIGDQTYVKVGDTYYQPIQKDGKNMYEVAQVEAEDSGSK